MVGRAALRPRVTGANSTEPVWVGIDQPRPRQVAWLSAQVHVASELGGPVSWIDGREARGSILPGPVITAATLKRLLPWHYFGTLTSIIKNKKPIRSSTSACCYLVPAHNVSVRVSMAVEIRASNCSSRK